jgi:RND family efflux transporter MFP subunit
MADDLSSELASLKISRDEPPRSSSGIWRALIWTAVVLGALALAWTFSAPLLKAKFLREEVALTEIAVVSPAQAQIMLTSSGYIVPQKLSSVAPKVPGRVQSIHVIQGQHVKMGDLLFELDPADEEAQVATGSSQVAASQARVMRARAEVETAKAQLAETEIRAARERKLASEGVGTQGAAEDLEARVASLRQQVRAAEAAEKAAQAETYAAGKQVDALKINLNNLSLFAPISGTVLNKPPVVGEFVGPLPAGVSVDMGGVEIADLSTQVVETDVPEGRLSLVKVGGPTEIVLDAFPQKRFRGRTIEITPQVDRAKATVLVKVKFEDDLSGVLPDMSARVSFLSEELDAEAMKEEPKTIVPDSAVVERDGAKVVFVYDEGKVRLTPVTLGPAYGRGFELEAGPIAGTKLVSDPAPTLTDGQSVKEKTDD